MRVAVIGLGDVRKRDKGIAIYLLDKLRSCFWGNFGVSFINAGVSGEDLFTTMKEVGAEKVIVLDTIRDIVSPGKIDYLIIRPNKSKELKEMIIITIGIVSEEWGKQLSVVLSKKFNQILMQVAQLVGDFLK